MNWGNELSLLFHIFISGLFQQIDIYLNLIWINETFIINIFEFNLDE